MGKSFLIILGIYLLYYAGNILYDLFLQKKKVVEIENNEQNFSLSELAQQHQEKPVSVEIEDVENLITPESFGSEEYIFLSKNEEPLSMEEFQKKYENKLYKENKIHLKEQLQGSEEHKKSIVDRPIKSLNLQNLLNDINTRVKMVANYDGQKVYHIDSNVNRNLI